MIVPNGVASILGKDIMDALTTNQNRLVTVLDLHRAIMSVNDQNRLNSNNPDVSGVFAKLSPNRTCSDVPLMPLVRCQCVGSEEKYEDNSPKMQWIAEFALGMLNNDIQNQYSEGIVNNIIFLDNQRQLTKFTVFAAPSGRRHFLRHTSSPKTTSPLISCRRMDQYHVGERSILCRRKGLVVAFNPPRILDGQSEHLHQKQRSLDMTFQCTVCCKNFIFQESHFEENQLSK